VSAFSSRQVAASVRPFSLAAPFLFACVLPPLDTSQSKLLVPDAVGDCRNDVPLAHHCFVTPEIKFNVLIPDSH
jgi:hypothetical protein